MLNWRRVYIYIYRGEAVVFLARYRESHCLGCFELWAGLDTEIGGASDRLDRRNVKGEAYTILYYSPRILMRFSVTTIFR